MKRQWYKHPLQPSLLTSSHSLFPCFLSSSTAYSTFSPSAPRVSSIKPPVFRLSSFRKRRKANGTRHQQPIISASSTSAPGSFSVPDDSSQPSRPPQQPSPFQPYSAGEEQQDDTSKRKEQALDNPSSSPSYAAEVTTTSEPPQQTPTSASAALQVDDGSLSGVSLIMPRRLYRKRGFDDIPVDLSSTLTQLRRGFDSGRGATIYLMCLFASWYWSNTMFNVYNKQILKVFPFPLTCTVIQFLVAGFIMISLWIFRIKKPPKFSKTLLSTALPLALFHGAGFILTNMSLGKVSVAFTHTVKSTEPFFSVALTPSILGEVPTWGIIGSLFPIVAGVALASATDVSFNWPGFLSAVGSNVALQSRNVLSKKLINQNDDQQFEDDHGLDNINLFAMITILAFIVFGPVCAIIEGYKLSAPFITKSATGMATGRLYRMLILGGICRCLDVLSSYMILQRVSPVTHSVGNCVKRAVVIIVSIFFFKTTMKPLNIVGTCLALAGVFAYSIIVSACKQNKFGPDSPFCKPVYELELTEGGGI